MDVNTLKRQIADLQSTNKTLEEVIQKRDQDLRDYNVKRHFLECVAFRQKHVLDDFLLTLKNKDEQICNLQATVNELEIHGKAKEEEVEKLEKRMRELETQLEEKNARVTALEGELSLMKRKWRVLKVALTLALKKVFRSSSKSLETVGVKDGEAPAGRSDTNRDDGDDSTFADQVAC